MRTLWLSADVDKNIDTFPAAASFDFDVKVLVSANALIDNDTSPTEDDDTYFAVSHNYLMTYIIVVKGDNAYVDVGKLQ